MKPLFKSLQLQEEFEQNGFVRVPFLTSDKVEELSLMYKTLEVEHEQIGLPFTTTSHSNNYELIQKADKQIARIFAPEMDKVLNDYSLLFGNFLVKQPGLESETPLHQDTTFVDETKFASISVWVSLQDTEKQNGCMRFVKGSHQFKFTLRPTHAYPWAFERVTGNLEKLLVDCPSKKGEAFIFHHGVIHASYPNLTAIPRVAAVMAAYPSQAELLMLYLEKGSLTNVQKYKMTKEAYLHFTKGEPPVMGELLNTEQFNFAQITPEEFDKMIKPSKSLLQKLMDGILTLREPKSVLN